jgi:UDP-glucose 4-epimerase
MDNAYLQELISEAESRGGGLLLNFNEKPAVVVLTVEKYNQLLNQEAPEDFTRAPQASPQADAFVRESQPKKILVTGGAGYIGAHLARQLLKAGHEVVILDNLSTGKRDNVPVGASFIEGDLADINLLRDLFAANRFDAVMHLAASLEVEESTRFPEKYFENNVINTSRLLMVMSEAGVKKIIFSSTAAVYGEPEQVPITEKSKVRPNNPYGFSKLLAEKAIKYHCAFSGLHAIVFRYFNACGCDFDGQIQPTHTSHLVPIVLGVAKGDRPVLVVYGDDYNTSDGTCVRDYVHVLDIVNAHVKALDYMDQGESFRVYNIGTGHGCSVREIINGASEILNRIIPMEIGPRRAGDAAITVADNTKLKQELGYELQYSDLNTIITTTWKQITANS